MREQCFSIPTTCERAEFKQILLYQLKFEYLHHLSLYQLLKLHSKTERQNIIHRSPPPSQNFRTKRQKQPLRWLSDVHQLAQLDLGYKFLTLDDVTCYCRLSSADTTDGRRTLTRIWLSTTSPQRTSPDRTSLDEECRTLAKRSPTISVSFKWKWISAFVSNPFLHVQYSY